MELPYSREKFFEVFAAYNNWLGAGVAVAWVASVAAVVFLAAGQKSQYQRTGLALLCGLWVLMGAGYHLAFFSEINSVALVFGAAFVLQAALLGFAALKASVATIRETGWRAWAGGSVIAYAVAGYALIGFLEGRVAPEVPRLGSSPCPTVILTLGCLTCFRLSRYLLIVPVLWAVVGTSAIWLFGVYEDAGLPIAALIALLAVWRRKDVGEIGADGGR